MTRYLTIAQILFLHARLINETGGSHGLRDLGMLEAASARPQATFDEQELYPDLYAKAAALMNRPAFLVGLEPVYIQGKIKCKSPNSCHR